MFTVNTKRKPNTYQYNTFYNQTNTMQFYMYNTKPIPYLDVTDKVCTDSLFVITIFTNEITSSNNPDNEQTN